MEIGEFEIGPDGLIRLEALRDFVVAEAKILVILRIHTSHREGPHEEFADRFLQLGMNVDQARILAEELRSAADRASEDMGSA